MNDSMKAFIGLGANLGDPIQQIVDARAELAALDGVMSWRCSAMYVSSPVGYSDQPNFINCVLVLETHYQPHELFAHMQRVEEQLGRVRDPENQNAPRLIDIDLILFGDECLDDEQLIVPHPRLSERLFVLEPLRELGVQIKPDSHTDFTLQILHRLFT